jgi:hypothetical protein
MMAREEVKEVKLLQSFRVFFSKDIGNMTERESKRFEMNPISLVSFDWPSHRNRKSNPYKTSLQTIIFKISIKRL